MLPTQDRNTKSFWQRPEGTTGMLTIAGGLGGLYLAAPIILGFLTTLVGIVGQAITLTILGTFLFCLLYVITNKKVQTLASYMFKSAMRKITGVFVEIDPIGIMRNYVEDLKTKREVLGQNRDKVRGQLGQLERKITENKAEHDEAMATAKVANSKGNTSQFSVAARQAERLAKLNRESYEPLRAQLEIHLRALSKYYEVTGTVIEDMGNEVKAKSDERKMIMASHSAMKAAKAILNGGTDERELFDQAMEFVVEDYHQRLGEIESFIDNSKGFVDGLDIRNGVYEEEALRKLQEWEKNTDSVLLGHEKARLLEHTAVSSSVYSGVSTPAAGQVDYVEVLRKK
jgi:hypothetical protein